MNIQKKYADENKFNVKKNEFIYLLVMGIMAFVLWIFVYSVIGNVSKNQAKSTSGKLPNLVMVIDTSNNMFARDVYPNRAMYAIRLSEKILKQQPLGKTGVIFFNEKSVKRSPFKTENVFNFNEAINYVERMASLPYHITNDNMINAVIQAFNMVRGEKNSKIILLTSGVGKNKSRLINLIRGKTNKKVQFSIVGIGTEIGDYVTYIDHNDGRNVDSSLSKLETKDLQDVAKVGKGFYFNQDILASDLHRILYEKR